MKNILVIDPRRSGVYYEPAFGEHGIKIFKLWSAREEHTIGRAELEENGPVLSFVHNFKSDLERLALWCKENSINYVLAGHETAVELNEHLRHKLAIEYRHDDATLLARFHKDKMQQALFDAGVPALKFCAVSDVDEAISYLKKYDFEKSPIVLKPVIGASSADVYIVDNLKDATKHVEQMFTSTGPFNEGIDAVLLQEFFQGTEYVIDTYSYDGVHSLVGSCQYTKHRTKNGDIVYDRLQYLDSDNKTVQALYAYALEVLDAVGAKNGPIHMELMKNGDDIRLIEVNDRMHGGHQTEVARKIFNDSQVDREVNYIAQGVAPAPSFSLIKQCREVYFSLEEPCKALDADFEKELSKVPGVDSVHTSLEAGKVYQATQTLRDGEELGVAVLMADSMQELEEAEDQLRKTFASFMQTV